MNSTTHHAIIDIETGETLFVEKCRNTMGGWANMANRIEERLGGRMRADDPHARNLVWTCGETRFRTEEVNAL